ncbi:redox-active disulfide protein 2 [Thermosipho sp. 1063]|uniref:thioredoxin family protein n=1 Tax=unclassified Thermosipho (in: thermotogales) TaxID=2676525 RepID=UPI0009492DD1|nr:MULTISPECIES: thioredoxin family protein [unclassified Thermosipho (in: thermotogales)]ANQ53671.1 redox-active disulfide protein 2 [Thermosipho sp. 1070]APT72117.1 redox-active disulfide protein 2 [Thermosipho sp. 1063]OOC43362.1 redox-active disulfide protein 2 [Thermosipho sp. 1074]
MKIEIFGSGCPKCKQTEKVVKMVVNEKGLDAVVEKVQDINEIVSRGIFATPAVAIDGKIVISGKVPTVDEVREFLKGD